MVHDAEAYSKDPDFFAFDSDPSPPRLVGLIFEAGP